MVFLMGQVAEYIASVDTLYDIASSGTKNAVTAAAVRDAGGAHLLGHGVPYLALKNAIWRTTIEQYFDQE